MNEGCFVRALWGDHKIPNFQQVLDEVKWCLERPYQPAPMLWCCYGKANGDYLRSLGIEPATLDAEGFSRFAAEAEEAPTRHYTERFGSDMFRHKYPAIRYALERYPDAVWLDLDVEMTEPLPVDFWRQCRKRAVFQSVLQQNHRKYASQRMAQQWPGKRHETDDSRKTPCGNLLYFRGLDTIDRALRLYAQYPNNWDLAVLSRLVDELMGGVWKPEPAYKEMGFDPGFHSLGKFEKSRQHFPPESRLFLTQWRKTGITKYDAEGKQVRGR